MAKGERGYHEVRRFKQNIERESEALKSLSVGAMRLIAGVAREHLGSSDVSISDDQLKDVLTRDVRRHPLDMSHAVEASHTERRKVPEDMVPTEAEKWAKEMAEYLQDRTKLPWDAAKILSKKFDLMLDEKPKVADGLDKKAQTISNRVETMIWNNYLKGDGKGASDVQQFIKDFVGRDTFTTVVSNLEKIKPFLGIFGKDSTIQQIEDGILAFAALNTLSPLSKERRDLSNQIKSGAVTADTKDLAHYNPENYQKEELSEASRVRVPEQPEKESLKPEPKLIEKGRSSELNREGWNEVAIANEISREKFEKEYKRIAEKLSVEQLEALNESIEKVFNELNDGEVRKDHVIRLIEPGDGENPQKITTYVMYKQSEDPDDLKVFEIDLNPKYRYFSDEGRLYESTTPDKKAEHIAWIWYQKKDAKVEESEIEKKFDVIALKGAIENAKAEFLEKGFREVGTLDILSPEQTDEFEKKLDLLNEGTDEQKAQYSEIVTKAQEDIGTKGYFVGHLLEPQNGENPGQDIIFFLTQGQTGGLVVGEIHKNEGMEDLNVDNGRFMRTMEDSKYTWWIPPEEPEGADTELGLQPAPVESVSTEDLVQEVTNPAPVEENGGDIPSVNEELLNQEALPEDEKGINPLPNEEGGINPNESLEDSIQNQQIPDSEQIDSTSPETTLENTNKSAVGEKLEENRSSGSDFRQDGPRRKGLGEDVTPGSSPQNVEETIQTDGPAQDISQPERLSQEARQNLGQEVSQHFVNQENGTISVNFNTNPLALIEDLVSKYGQSHRDEIEAMVMDAYQRMKPHIDDLKQATGNS